MSFFQDKEYEEMDWLNLAVEEPTFSLNDILVTLPNSIEITPELIEKTIVYNEVNISMLVSPYLPGGLQQREEALLLRAFEFKMPERKDDLFFNFETSTLSDPVFLVKTTTFFESKELMDVVYNMCAGIILDQLSNNRHLESARVNEIADFLDANSKIRSTRSAPRKVRVLQALFKDVILNDKWKIRNMDLFIKSATWACEYIRSGNLAALTNFNKLKVMTHKKQPIYSMEETI